MKVTKYEWEDAATPALPYHDNVLEKFSEVIVVTNEDNAVTGYAGVTTKDSRIFINCFWIKKRNQEVTKELLAQLKKLLNWNKQKRIGLDVDIENKPLIECLKAADFYLYENTPRMGSEAGITGKPRACFMLSIPPNILDKIKEK